MPCGFGADGLPVSLTAMTSAFEEHKGISLARFFQALTSWHQKRPPLLPVGVTPLAGATGWDASPPSSIL